MDDKTLDSTLEVLMHDHPIIMRIIHRSVFKAGLEALGENILPPHLPIMRMLYEAGTLHVTGIGGELLISKPQMTYLIDELINLGMVERQSDQVDRRKINISLTDKGKTTVEKCDGIMRNIIKTKLSSLKDEDLEELSISLRKVKDILSKLQ